MRSERNSCRGGGNRPRSPGVAPLVNGSETGFQYDKMPLHFMPLPQRGSPCQPRATPWVMSPIPVQALKGRPQSMPQSFTTIPLSLVFSVPGRCPGLAWGRPLALMRVRVGCARRTNTLALHTPSPADGGYAKSLVREARPTIKSAAPAPHYACSAGITVSEFRKQRTENRGTEVSVRTHGRTTTRTPMSSRRALGARRKR